MRIYWKPFRAMNIDGEPIVVECDTFNVYGVQYLALISAMPPGKPVSWQWGYDHWVAEGSRLMLHTGEGGGKRCAAYLNKGLVKALADEGYKIILKGDEFELVY